MNLTWTTAPSNDDSEYEIVSNHVEISPDLPKASFRLRALIPDGDETRYWLISYALPENLDDYISDDDEYLMHIVEQECHLEFADDWKWLLEEAKQRLVDLLEEQPTWLADWWRSDLEQHKLNERDELPEVA